MEISNKKINEILNKEHSPKYHDKSDVAWSVLLLKKSVTYP